ncbi:TonB-dependent receptor plug domain-containing protein [Hyphomicrobium sp.]|uniref:TonB-dependent receptor plug domain-containing protein n=1 Tax=Hyphomicrobium sp. TaxID=82 RepID=UPI0025C07F2A|nr:TonB-dependent receptor plug domain-containing protein [Hyphomicrobium sp.]
MGNSALNRATRAGGTAAMAVLMLPLAASAQNAEGPTELEPVTVTGTQPKSAKKNAKKKSPPAAAQSAPTPQAPSEAPRGPSTTSATGAVNGFVGTDTTTGSKSPTAIKDIPQFVSVVGRDEIDTQGAQKADEALRYTSGVFAQPFGADTDMNWLFIRGFDATQKGIYLDGLQLYNHAFGSFYVDSFALERI